MPLKEFKSATDDPPWPITPAYLLLRGKLQGKPRHCRDGRKQQSEKNEGPQQMSCRGMALRPAIRQAMKATGKASWVLPTA
jgi:hypothetical protein